MRSLIKGFLTIKGDDVIKELTKLKASDECFRVQEIRERRPVNDKITLFGRQNSVTFNKNKADCKGLSRIFYLNTSTNWSLYIAALWQKIL